MSGAVKGKDYAVDGNAASNATAPSDPAKVDQHQEDQLNARLQQNEDAGARVMDFDENATPEEKAAKAKGLMPKGVPHLRKNKANGNGSSKCV